MGIPLKKFIPGIAWFFVVLTLVCLPGEDLPEVGDWFNKIDFDKFIHCGIFGFLALLWIWPVAASAGIAPKGKKNWIIRIMLAASIFGYITELLQKFYVPGRNFSLLDAAADILGAIVASALAYWIFIKRKAKSAAIGQSAR